MGKNENKVNQQVKLQIDIVDKNEIYFAKKHDEISNSGLTDDQKYALLNNYNAWKSVKREVDILVVEGVIDIKDSTIFFIHLKDIAEKYTEYRDRLQLTKPSAIAHHLKVELLKCNIERYPFLEKILNTLPILDSYTSSLQIDEGKHIGGEILYANHQLLRAFESVWITYDLKLKIKADVVKKVRRVSLSLAKEFLSACGWQPARGPRASEETELNLDKFKSARKYVRLYSDAKIANDERKNCIFQIG